MKFYEINHLSTTLLFAFDASEQLHHEFRRWLKTTGIVPLFEVTSHRGGFHRYVGLFAMPHVFVIEAWLEERALRYSDSNDPEVLRCL